MSGERRVPPLIERIDGDGNWIEETGEPEQCTPEEIDWDDDGTVLACGLENPEVCESCQ